jgi:SAM-dependent methyltransferase
MTQFSAQQFEVYPDGIDAHFWMLARHRIVLRALRRLRPAGRILDVGCGRGISTLFLRRHHLDVVGCDLGKPDPYDAEVAPYITYETSAFDLPAGVRRSVSTVLLLDVIEHIDDRERWLNELAAAYPHLRSVLLTVPARKELWSNYDDYYGHFIRFDGASIAALAQRSPFALAKRTYFFHALYAPMWLAARLRGQRNLRPGAPSGAAARLVNRFIGWCFDVEERVAPPSLPGGSMLAVLERNLR